MMAYAVKNKVDRESAWKKVRLSENIPGTSGIEVCGNPVIAFVYGTSFTYSGTGKGENCLCGACS